MKGEEKMKGLILNMLDRYYLKKYLKTRNPKYCEKYRNIEGKYFGTDDPIYDEYGNII